MNFNHFGEPQLFYIRIPNVPRSPFLFNLQRFNSTNKYTICHIFIPSLPFFTFFCIYFHLFLGNFSLINNHRNNICDLKSPSYKKLVQKDKNGNVILNLTCILGKFNTKQKC
jgi:hypothetical protein